VLRALANLLLLPLLTSRSQPSRAVPPWILAIPLVSAWDAGRRAHPGALIFWPAFNPLKINGRIR
jgi:hypothetical protein